MVSPIYFKMTCGLFHAGVVSDFQIINVVIYVLTDHFYNVYKENYQSLLMLILFFEKR